MKYRHVRNAEHYCCEMCDGPYSKYKKTSGKRVKNKEKSIVKKQIKKELETKE